MKRILLALFGIPVIFCPAQENWDRVGETRAASILRAVSDPQARETVAAALRVIRDETSGGDLLEKAEAELYAVDDPIAKLAGIYFALIPGRTNDKADKLVLKVDALPILID